MAGEASPPDRVRPTRQPRWFVVLLGLLSAFGPLCIDMYLPALPALSKSLHAQASAAQLTLTGCLAGLAIGQLLTGPLSDRYGRREPLLIGLTAFVLSSVACVFAPSIYALVAFRFVQGCAGGAGIVIARAMVRDLYSGIEAAYFFSILMLVVGSGPVLAPLIGGQLLRFTSWRGVFVVLASIGVVLFAGSVGGIRETLPRAMRHVGGVAATLRTFRMLSRDRTFMRYALPCGLAFGALFAYISGSPFVLENIYHLSPQWFSVTFGVNALGLIAAGQTNARLVRRVSPQRLLMVGLTAMTAGGLWLIAVVALIHTMAGILVGLFVVMSSLGLVSPNALALALADHPRVAGSASALVGFSQNVFGGLAAPFVGISGSHDAVPMVVAIAAFAGLALLTFCGLASGRRPVAAPELTPERAG